MSQMASEQIPPDWVSQLVGKAYAAGRAAGQAKELEWADFDAWFGNYAKQYDKSQWRLRDAWVAGQAAKER